MKQSNLDARIGVMLENAMLAANPPIVIQERRQAKLRTPIEHFIRWLVYDQLESRRVEKIIKLLRSLPWGQRVEQEVWGPEAKARKESGDIVVKENEEMGEPAEPIKAVVDIDSLVLKLFCKIWKVKYDLVFCMADVASGIAEFHDDFAIALVDYVLEQIRLGMEDLTHFRYQQRRVCCTEFVVVGYLYL